MTLWMLAVLSHRRAPVLEHPRLEGGIDPGAGDHPRAALRAPLVHRFDLAPDVLGREKSLFDEELHDGRGQFFIIGRGQVVLRMIYVGVPVRRTHRPSPSGTSQCS